MYSSSLGKWAGEKINYWQHLRISLVFSDKTKGKIHICVLNIHICSHTSNVFLLTDEIRCRLLLIWKRNLSGKYDSNVSKIKHHYLYYHWTFYLIWREWEEWGEQVFAKFTNSGEELLRNREKICTICPVPKMVKDFMQEKYETWCFLTYLMALPENDHLWFVSYILVWPYSPSMH